MGGLISSIGLGAGSNEGSAGTKYSAEGAKLLNTVTEDQLKGGWDQSQDALEKQRQFLAALQGQNGIQNQSNVYNQLAGIANGTGPNPAQAALNQATQANIANQAALMAGQRGASQNAGLIARQAGMQGGNIQQQAVGQGATMQAQQALNAIGQMGGIAGQQVGQEGGALSGLNSAAQNLYGTAQQAASAFNNAKVGMQSNVNNDNAGIANTVAQGQQKMAANLTGAGGAALPMIPLAHGGEVPHYAVGGGVMPQDMMQMQAAPMPMGQQGPLSFVGQFNARNIDAGMPQIGAANFTNVPWDPEKQKPQPQQKDVTAPLSYDTVVGKEPMAGGPMDVGAPMPAAQDPSAGGGGMGLMSMLPMLVAHGGKIPVVGEQLAANGKMVPGSAKVKGDSLKNDTVDAKLSPGEIVIPRSIAQSKDAPRKSAEFVAAVLRKKGRL